MDNETKCRHAAQTRLLRARYYLHCLNREIAHQEVQHEVNPSSWTVVDQIGHLEGMLSWVLKHMSLLEDER